MKKLVFITALVLSLGLVGCSETTTKEETPKDEKPVAEIPVDDASKKETSFSPVSKEGGKLTKEKFNHIKLGMTTEEVFSIIGSKGNVISETETDGDSSVIYEFEIDDGSPSSTMVFQNDKLNYKARIGEETSNIEITIEQFNKLEKGMSKEKVFEILGGKGEIIAESSTLEIYSYNGTTLDAKVSISFNDGKLKSKDQKGSI